MSGGLMLLALLLFHLAPFGQEAVCCKDAHTPDLSLQA